ncbi:MAG: PadR family transcriptional regulator [Bacteroidota bacterium]
MERIYLGELEELVLLMVSILHGNAYGVSVKEELEKQTGRSINISAIHAALRRLLSKGFVTSQWSEATAQRGGRRKRIFTITSAGFAAIQHINNTRSKLWTQIPIQLIKPSFE